MSLKKDDIVQIVPEHNWGGCLLVVDEVKSWGIQGYVEIPLKGQAYIRIKNGEFEVVGRAVFVID